MTIEQVIRVVFDDNGYTRNVTQAAAVSGRFDSSVNSVTASLLAMSKSASQAGAAQALAANSGGAFLAALQKQAATLTQQSSVIGKSEADLLRLKAAELGVAQQAGATIAALEEQSRAVARLGAGARAVENIRATAALRAEQQAVEAGIATDLKAGRAKQDLITQIERETAALTRLAAVPRGTASAERGPTGSAVDRVRDAAAADPEFAARAQPALINLGAAQAARDQAIFIASLERTASAAGKTRAELLALEAAERGVSAQAAPLIARIAAVDKSFQSFSKTGRLTALELQQVGFQLNDFFVQVASGQGLFLPLIQQGSQLSGTFGGIGAALRAVGSLITPVVGGVLALGGAAVGIGLAAAATEKWQRSLSDLQATLQGTGRGGQFSNGQLAALIEQISQAPEVTRDAAIKSVAELARVSQISGKLFGDLGRLAADYARVTGTDVPAATKALAQAFADPAQGAKTLEAALGRLSTNALLAVRDLTNVGDRAGAQRALLAGLEEAIRGLADKGLTPMQRASNDLGNSWDRLMGTFRDSDGLKQLNSSLAELVNRINTAVANAPKLGLLGTLAAQSGPLAAVARGVQAVLPERTEPGRRRVEGKVTFSTPAAEAAANSAAGGANAVQDQIKQALVLGASYESTGFKITQLVAKQAELRKGLQLATSTFGATSKEALTLRSSVAGITDQIESLRNKGAGSGGDPDRELKRQTAAAIELARREADTVKAQVAAQNEDLREQYATGEIDLATYYRRRVELTKEGAAAEQAAIEKAIAERTLESQIGKKKETREDAAEKLPALREQAIKAAADAERARTKVAQDGRQLEAQLTRALIDQEIELAQLAGDEFKAETLRNAQRVAQFKTVADQKFGRGSPEADGAVSRLQAAVALQADSNQLQRDAQALSQRSAIEEERFLIAARARGATQQETERGLFDIRSRAIAQLTEQVTKAEALANAAAPNSPTVLFAQQLRLELERLTAAVDPAMERLRGVADEVADAFGEAAGAITLNFRDIGSAFKSLEQSLLRIGTRELVEKPFTEFIRKQIGGVIEPGQGGGLGQGIRDIFGVAVKGAATGGASSQPANPFSLDGVFGGIGQGGNLGNSIGLPPGILNLSGGGGLSGGAPTDPFSSAIQSIASLGTAAEGSTDSLGGLAEVPTTFALLSLAQAAQAAALALGSLSGGAGASKLAGGGGGLFSSITGGAGSSGGLDWIGNTFIKLFGLSEGGFTGPGAKMEPAGIVHRGEYVTPQERVAEPGALRFLERFREVGMQQTLKETFIERVQASAGKQGQIQMPAGFAEGGLVGGAIADAARYARMPAYADGGLATMGAGLQQEIAGERPMQRLMVNDNAGGSTAPPITLIYNAPPGESRSTHMQNAQRMFEMGAQAQRRNG